MGVWIGCVRGIWDCGEGVSEGDMGVWMGCEWLIMGMCGVCVNGGLWGGVEYV